MNEDLKKAYVLLKTCYIEKFRNKNLIHSLIEQLIRIN